jgi:hypothetical protein
MEVDRRRLRLGIDDQIRDRYHHVPFMVDRGATSVEVVLTYDDTQGVVDLGCEGALGWRGWSGGARRRFVITADTATPGYLPGELEEGVWHVVLGLHKIPAAGLEVALEIRLPADAPPEPEPAAPPVSRPDASRPRPPAPPGLTWLAGDFHAHTLHSDGTDTVAGLAARAVLAGLDFLAVTDHNTTSHHAGLPRAAAAHGITLIPGQEVTTARGHANALGDIGWVDFREPADTWVETVARRGGILSVNHPVEADCSWQHPLTSLPPALELWHSSWLRAPDSTAPWAFWRRWSADAVLLGGSDFHGPGRGGALGSPVTWVAAEDHTAEAVLDAVRAGRTAISTRPGPDVPVLVRVEDDLVAVAAESSVLVDGEGRRRRVTSAHERVPVSWGQGVFHLEDADRRLLAIC